MILRGVDKGIIIVLAFLIIGEARLFIGPPARPAKSTPVTSSAGQPAGLQAHPAPARPTPPGQPTPPPSPVASQTDAGLVESFTEDSLVLRTSASDGVRSRVTRYTVNDDTVIVHRGELLDPETASKARIAYDREVADLNAKPERNRAALDALVPPSLYEESQAWATDVKPGAAVTVYFAKQGSGRAPAVQKIVLAPAIMDRGPEAPAER